MVPWTTLVLPLIVSAILVFVASSIIHMVLPYHRNDVLRMPAEKEAEFLETLRRLNLSPGDYAAPHAGSMAGMKDPAFVAKMSKGPLVFMTAAPGMAPAMGKNLAQWFVYIIVVNCFAGCFAARVLSIGSSYDAVFCFIGATAFMGYAMALPQHSIWYRRNWLTTAKSMFDGLVYASLTAGVFGWLWPR
jgi:hypothetical protein